MAKPDDADAPGASSATAAAPAKPWWALFAEISLFLIVFEVAAVAGVLLAIFVFAAPEWHPLAIAVLAALSLGGFAWSLKIFRGRMAMVGLIGALSIGIDGVVSLWREPHWYKVLLLPIAISFVLFMIDVFSEATGRKLKWSLLELAPRVQMILFILGLVGLSGYWLMEHGFTPWMLALPAIGLVAGWGRLSRAVEASCIRFQEDRRRRLISGG